MAQKTTTGSNIWSKVGVWSYIAGLVIALLVAIFSGIGGLASWAIWTLVILGVIVGLLNIGDDEVLMYLVASVAFVVSASALEGVFAAVGGLTMIETFMNAIIVFTAPGALVVAFKALYQVAKSD